MTGCAKSALLWRLRSTATPSRIGDEPSLFGTAYAGDVRHLVNSAGVEAITLGPGAVRRDASS